MTITEIAKMAGVSIAAVSRYMNDGYLAEEKKERIRKVIEETGYVPSAQAQTLRTRRTKLVGVILPKIDSESVSRVTAGISEILTEAGYQMLLADTRNDPEKELEYLKIFKNNNVDGIIFLATRISEEHDKLLRAFKIPAVMVGQHVGYMTCVYHNDEGAAYELTRLLIKAERKHPGYLGVTMEDEACGKQRFCGFKRALEEAGKEFEEGRLTIGEFTMESGYQNAKALMEKYTDTDAIFCATDTIALGAYKYLREAGIRIPEQVALCGVGDTKISGLIEPSLTTAHLYYKTSGIEAAKLLLTMVGERNMPQKQIELGYQIIANESAP